MDRNRPSYSCEVEVAHLAARVAILEKQLAQIQPTRSSDTVGPKAKIRLPEATASTDPGPSLRIKAAKRSKTTKAELLTCPPEAKDDRKFDRRYLTGRGPPITRRAFSKAYLQWTLDDMDLRVTALRYRHRRATNCPTQNSCQHWNIVDGTEPLEEGDIYVILLCIDTESVEEGDSCCKGINMFDGEEPRANRITLQPCRIFNALMPDFSAIWDKGYTVLHCLLLDYRKTEEEDGDEWKWMGQFGRLLSRM
ncbi:integral membrane protein PTH11 [Fusarium bulbicola]|nr:integral membrane protein PTH11 [Fusarium bulbicola]